MSVELAPPVTFECTCGSRFKAHSRRLPATWSLRAGVIRCEECTTSYVRRMANRAPNRSAA